MINFSVGILFVYTSEVYSTNIRGIALGLGSSINRLGCFNIGDHNNDRLDKSGGLNASLFAPLNN